MLPEAGDIFTATYGLTRFQCFGIGTEIFIGHIAHEVPAFSNGIQNEAIAEQVALDL